MRGLFYRLLGRRKLLLKSVLILSLITLASFVVALLPQLANPHILGKYLSNLTSGAIYIEEQAPPYFDFEVSGQTNTPAFIENFDQMLEKSSTKTFGVFLPESYNLFIKEFVVITNETITNETTTGGFIVGISNDLYDLLKNHSTNNNTSTGAIILSQYQNDTLGTYSIKFREQNTTLTVNKKINYESFDSIFPFVNYYLTKIESNQQRFFFIQIDELITLFDDIVKDSDEPYYELMGYISFKEYQRDIIYWSIDSPKLIEDFQQELIANIQQQNPSNYISFQFDYFVENAMFVNIVFSFIRGLQLLIWGIAFILGISTVAKIQKINRDQELRIIFAGQKWFKRIVNLFTESLLIIITSVSFALVIIYPFIKFQSAFKITLALNKSIILEFILIPVILLLTLFATYLDFEFYLRRIIRSRSKNQQYKPFAKIPMYVKLILPLLIVLILWLLNRNLISLLAFAAFLLISIIICYLTILFVRLILNTGKKIYHHQKKRADKPVSSMFILLKLWKKMLSSKLLLYTFMLTIISAAFLFVNFTADAKRTEFMWWSGGEIEFWAPATNTTIIDGNLETISEIVDYTKLIFFNQYFNGSEHYSYSLIENVITEVNSSYEGERIYYIIGINSTDYFNFYESWNMKNWLAEGQLNSLNGNNIFISQKIQRIGFGLEDTLKFMNESIPLTIKGVIDAWPSITDQYGERSSRELMLIMDYELLQSILDAKDIDYNVRYKVHTTEKQIKSTAEELIPMLSSINSLDEMSYLDLDVFVGLRKIFLEPIVVVFQILILLWCALFAYTNFDNVNFSLEARNLGIIALAKDFREPLLRFKILEGFLLYGAFLFIFGLLYALSYGLLLGTGIAYGIKSIIISKYTIINLLFLLLFYPGLLLIQAIVEYFNLRRINLSLMYRHPE